jgi:predicted metal-dependent phosphoesterase TrpH
MKIRQQILMVMVVLMSSSIVMAQDICESDFDCNAAVEIIGETIQYPIGWWRGNTHTHINLSPDDGDSSPADVARRYEYLGYDFLVLTPHGWCSHLFNFENYYSYSSDFLIINGEELTSNTNHVNGIGLTAYITPDNTTESLINNVNNVVAQGGIAILNHPTWHSLPVHAGQLFSIDNLKFIEIYNAHVQSQCEELWDDLLSGGKLIYGVASDDSHHLIPEAGSAWIVVRASVLTRENILTAMDDGDFYASTGIVLNDYSADDYTMIVDAANGDLIEFIGQDGQLLQSIAGSYGEYTFDGSENYVRARITNEQTGEKAWCQPKILMPPPLPRFTTTSMEECSISIEPGTAEVISGQALTFTVTTKGSCGDPGYEWSVQSRIGSRCDHKTGSYVTGININIFTPATDVVSVIDHRNGDQVDVATITVFSCPALQIYGEDSEEVVKLRAFRDKVLSKTPEGQELIKLYYEWSSIIVKAMEADEEFKEKVKEMIDGVLMFIAEEAE